jgi:hypothetical protein
MEMLKYIAGCVLPIEYSGDFDSNLQKRQIQLENEVCSEIRVSSGKECAHMSDAEKSDYFSAFSRQLLRQHTLDYIKLAARGFGVLMLGGNAYRLGQILDTSRDHATRILLLYTVPCLLFACLGLVAFWIQNRSLFYLAFFVISYFIVLSTGASAYSRYRVPIMPLYGISVAAGIHFSFRQLRRNPGLLPGASTASDTASGTDLRMESAKDAARNGEAPSATEGKGSSK